MQQPSREAVATNMIAYPEASTLVFENLTSLVSFRWDDRRVQWPSLEDVTVNNCPVIKKSGLGNVDISQLKSMKVILQDKEEDDPEIKINEYFELSDKFESIEKFEINDAEELSKTLAMKLKPSYFKYLLEFQAKNCDGRLNNFLSILLERSKQLKHLIIKECKSIDHVFDLDKLDTRDNGQYLANLETMKLWELPQLNCIWNDDPTGIFGLGHLEKISILKCSSLKNVISVCVAEKLQRLQVLKLYSCDKVEEVVAMENQGLGTQKRIITFPQLSYLVLVKLSSLLRFHNGNCALEFPTLGKLRIENCPQMIAFTTGFVCAGEPSTTDNGRALTMLNELKLVECGKLRYIIPSNILPGFQNLKKLNIINCNSLEELFPIHGEFHSEVPMLPQLSDLVLTQLPRLMHVINIKFANTRFFERLQILQVKDCNSLEYLFLPFLAGSLVLREIKISDCKSLEKIFVTKEDKTSIIQFSDLKSIALENLPKLLTFSPGTFDFPSLESLEVVNCPALKTFVKFDEMKDLPASSNNCFFNSESMENLKELHIRNQDGFEKLLHDNLPSKTFCELKKLILIEINHLLNVIPSGMLIRYKKLEKMTLEGCKLLKEVFDLEKVSDNHAKEILPQINGLILNKLPSLVHVWNREPQVPVFQNLASLQIIDCDKLKRLFSLSTAKYLQKLKVLKLYGCKEMEEVLFVDDVGLTKINFPTVERLILKDLPKLVSFCRDSCTFEWPELKTVRVSKIPEMETFSQGSQSTPKLRTVFVTFVKKCWQGDLNSSIKYLRNNPENGRE